VFGKGYTLDPSSAKSPPDILLPPGTSPEQASWSSLKGDGWPGGNWEQSRPACTNWKKRSFSTNDLSPRGQTVVTHLSSIYRYPPCRVNDELHHDTLVHLKHLHMERHADMAGRGGLVWRLQACVSMYNLQYLMNSRLSNVLGAWAETSSWDRRLFTVNLKTLVNISKRNYRPLCVSSVVAQKTRSSKDIHAPPSK
jgi:hypothetical protein